MHIRSETHTDLQGRWSVARVWCSSHGSWEEELGIHEQEHPRDRAGRAIQKGSICYDDLSGCHERKKICFNWLSRKDPRRFICLIQQMLLIDFGHLISFPGWSNSWMWARRTGCHSWVKHYSCCRRDGVSRRQSLKLWAVVLFYFVLVFLFLGYFKCMYASIYVSMCACMHLVWLFVFVDVHAWTCLNTNMGGGRG